MTEEEARYDFDNLLNDDENFNIQWGSDDNDLQKRLFYEWCSLYYDLKHIKPKDNK